MSQDATPSAALDALLGGKRGAPRRALDLPVRLRGVDMDWPATTRDLSLGGALVRIPIEAITGQAGGSLGPAEQFALLERSFRDSFDLHFQAQDVVVEAQVVRLLVATEAVEVLSLGCRFVEPLGAEQQRRLGLLERAAPELPTWGEATRKHALVRAADPARPVTALLGDDPDDPRGPLFAAPVAAVGRACLLVRLEGASAEELQAELGGGPRLVRLLAGRACLLESSAQLLALRYQDLPRPGVEVLLGLPRRLPRAVLSRFRRVV